MLQQYLWKGLRIRYLDQGSGPAMIFLHNACTDHTIWGRQLDVFKRTHRILAVDMPGYGSSDRPDQPYDLELFVSFLKDFIDDLKIESPILVGNCVGGAACLEYTLRHPARATALILFNVCGGSPMIPSLKWFRGGLLSPALFAKIFSHFGFSVAKDLWGAPPRKDDSIYRHYMDVTTQHPQVALSRKNMIRGGPSYTKFGNAFERPEKLPPILLLWGVKNRVLRIEHGRSLRDRLKPDQYHEISSGGHLAMAEAAEEVNSLMVQFLNSRGR